MSRATRRVLPCALRAPSHIAYPAPHAYAAHRRTARRAHQLGDAPLQPRERSALEPARRVVDHQPRARAQPERAQRLVAVARAGRGGDDEQGARAAAQAVSEQAGQLGIPIRHVRLLRPTGGARRPGGRRPRGVRRVRRPRGETHRLDGRASHRTWASGARCGASGRVAWARTSLARTFCASARTTSDSADSERLMACASLS